MAYNALHEYGPAISKPWRNLGLLVLITSIGSLISLGVVAGIFGFEAALEWSPVSTQASRKFLLTATTIEQSIDSIGAPLLYWYFVIKKPVSHLFQWRQNYIYPMLLTVGLVVSYLVLIVATIAVVKAIIFFKWSTVLNLSTFLTSWEQSGYQEEVPDKIILALLTTCHGTTDFLNVLLVLAVLPAIGEELIYRRILPNLFYSITKNTRVAIYLSAFCFSGAHLQFWGLIPQFVGGTFLGYLYLWTQDLLFPMLAHFVNNALLLVIALLCYKKCIEQEMYTDVLILLSIAIIALFTFISIMLAIALRRHSKYVHTPKNQDYPC